jgi:hypothetical protein
MATPRFIRLQRDEIEGNPWVSVRPAEIPGNRMGWEGKGSEGIRRPAPNESHLGLGSFKCVDLLTRSSPVTDESKVVSKQRVI